MKCGQINYKTYSNASGKIHKQVTDISDEGVVHYKIVYKEGVRVNIGKEATCGIQTFASWADKEVD